MAKSLIICFLIAKTQFFEVAIYIEILTQILTAFSCYNIINHIEAA